MSASPSIWDQIPSEPVELYAAFCAFLASDALVAPNTPDAARWAWNQRRAAYRAAAKEAASALARAEAVLRPHASTLALRAAAAAQEIVVSRLEAWARAPATVSDAIVVTLMREQRQREQRTVVDAALAPPPVPHAVLAAAFDGCSKEELAALERSAEIVAKYKKAAGIPNDDRIIEW